MSVVINGLGDTSTFPELQRDYYMIWREIKETNSDPGIVWMENGMSGESEKTLIWVVKAG